MSRPHIIFIVTDQQRFDTIRALGEADAFAYVDTPHLDRLVREGVTFTNCHISAPSCAPSRASLFTGYYPHTTGILKNGDPWRHGWIEDLQAGGYRTINVGKMHTAPFETPMGFEERYVVENKDRFLEGRYYFDEWDKALRSRGLVKQQRELYRQRPDYEECLGAFTWDLPADTQPDNFVGDLATWWIRSKPRDDRPLFLQIGFPGPHPPYDPTPDLAEKYMRRQFPLQEVTQTEIDSQPTVLRQMREHNAEVDHDSVVHLLDPTPAQRHRQRAHYMANIEMIDTKIGEILQALEEQGYLDDAVVVFTSDHGDCLTDHGHSQKWTCYDTITRMPLIVWRPGQADGRRVDGLCQQMDIGPAILEWAGVEVPDTLEARSLRPAVEGDDWSPRQHVYAEHGRDGTLQGTAFMTMVRSADWKLVHLVDSQEGQLFDLRQDPDEVDNRWDDPSCAEQKRALLDELRQWRIQSDVHTAGWTAAWR